MSKHFTPLQAIHRYCVWCCGGSAGSANGPRGCNTPECPLYTRRLGNSAGGGAAKAIRKRCLECVGSPDEVKKCKEESCALLLFKSGRNPKLAGRGLSDTFAKHGYKKLASPV